MSTLDRKKLRRLILKEFQKMKEDSLRPMHDDPGRQSYVASKGHHCHECGYGMKEGDAVCEQCGSMYEAELNEGGCGCPPPCAGCGPIDADLDNDFIPDHMTPQGGHDFDEMQDAMFDRFPHMKHIDVEFDYQKNNHHGGAYMAKSQLYKVSKYAEKLYNIIPDGHNLEDWMRTKLAQISDDISEVYHALDHDSFEGDI